MHSDNLQRAGAGPTSGRPASLRASALTIMDGASFRRSIRYRWVPLFVLFLFAGCAAALYTPSDKDARGGVKKEELLRGRELYVQKCGSCHSLYLPGMYSEPEWEGYLLNMADRAHLTAEEQKLILQFLSAGIAQSETE